MPARAGIEGFLDFRFRRNDGEGEISPKGSYLLVNESEMGTDRRGFVATLFASTGLVASYGLLAAFAGRFLYPMGKRVRRKMYVASLESLPVGEAVSISTPTGEQMVIAHTQDGVKAYSSKCPHLGCQVFWRPELQDFHCPCHGGRFDKNGVAVEGPPAKEGKNLMPVDIAVEGQSVFAKV